MGLLLGVMFLICKVRVLSNCMVICSVMSEGCEIDVEVEEVGRILFKF